MNTFDWKLKGLSKGISPSLAAKELARIEKKYGALRPEFVVDESKSPNAVFHKLFEWDDTLAAANFRLQQARTIINNVSVKIIHNGESRSVPVYEVVTTPGQGRVYKNVNVFSDADAECVRRTVLLQLQALQEKLGVFDDFYVVRELIAEATSHLKKVKVKKRGKKTAA